MGLGAVGISHVISQHIDLPGTLSVEHSTLSLLHQEQILCHPLHTWCPEKGGREGGRKGGREGRRREGGREEGREGG